MAAGAGGVTPGNAALSPTYIATINGDTSETAPFLPTANHVHPVKSFGYVWNGQNLSFYKGMPRIVPPALKAQLIAKGLVT